MPRGFSSIHPDQERRLRAVGLKSSQITQGVGGVSASAGLHVPVGTKGGRRFGWCIDLSVRDKHDAKAFRPTRANFDALVAHGFVPFYRSGGSWAGNEHYHLVDVAWLKNDAGKVPNHGMLPRSQVEDFLKTPPRNGLRGHAPLSKAWSPTKSQQAVIRQIFRTGKAPQPESLAVKVCDVKTGRVIETHQLAPNGDHLDDQGKIYVIVKE